MSPGVDPHEPEEVGSERPLSRIKIDGNEVANLIND